MHLRVVSILCPVVFLLCLAAFPLIDYVGGRSCMPLDVLLFPACIVPLGIELLTILILVIAVVRSLKTRRHRTWTLAALAVVIISTAAYWTWAGQLPGFLEGLRDRFVARVGYPKMREFAREVLAGTPLTSTDGVIQKPGKYRPASDEQTETWNDLVSRYPFLAWTHSAGVIFARDGLAELTWGSPLIGHFGFQVAPDGAVKDVEEEDGRFLRVAEDIQFVYYYD